MTDTQGAQDVANATVEAADKAGAAEDDSILADILGAPAASEPAPGPEAEEEGEPEPAPKAKAKEPEEEGEDDEEDESSSDPDFDAAYTALKRAGLTDKALKRMSNTEILQSGLKAQQRRVAEDNLNRKVQQLEAELESKSKQAESGGNASQPDGPAFDFDTLDAPLGELLGEDGAGLLKGAMQQSHSSLASQMAPLRKEMESVKGLVEQMLVRASRERLRERFPGLADDDVFKAAIYPKMVEFAKTGTYVGEAERLMKEAYVALSVDDPTLTIVDTSKAKKSSRRKATSTVPSTNKRSTATRENEGDWETKVALAAINGDEPALKDLSKRPM